MSQPVSLNAQELHQGVQQLLEHYQRCGLTHVPSQVDRAMIYSIASTVLDASHSTAVVNLECTTQSAQTITKFGAAASNVGDNNDQVVGSATLGDSGAGQAKTVASKVPLLFTNEPAGTQRLSCWNLPGLALDERRSQLDKLNEQVKACKLCADIVTYRHQTVFGDGTLQPTICFFGEAPGADEDREGKPFVGKAGQLLNRIIEAMALKRSDVYILNALKCRPPQNRTPVPDEIDNCRRFVEAQLGILQPKFIVCLGAVAVRSLLGTTESVGRLRGRFHQYRAARVVVTYHPAYLLRNESAKKFVWEDMQMLMREIGMQSPKPG